jgi:hypothetical protein
MRLRNNLILLVIATALPLVMLAVLASYLLVSHEQANFIGAVKDRNRAFMSAADAEIKGHVTTLQALTSLRSIVHGDLEAAYEDLVAVQRTQPWWLDVFLSTPDGRQLVNSLVPYGGPMPASVDPASVRRAASARQPVVSGITDLPLVGKPGITVCVPVLQQNEVAYVVSAVIDPAAFEALLNQQNLPQGWISGLVDAQDRFVARVPPAAARDARGRRLPRASRRIERRVVPRSDGRGPRHFHRVCALRLHRLERRLRHSRGGRAGERAAHRMGAGAVWRCCASVLRSSQRSGSGAGSRLRSGTWSIRSRRSAKARRSRSERGSTRCRSSPAR